MKSRDRIMHIFISALISISYAETTDEKLARQSTEYGNLKIVSSKSTDPIGIAGLWGMEGNFIVAASCTDTFAALQDITSYPTYTSSVKKVEVVEQTRDSLTVDYTEGGFGFESTSRQLWTFQPTVVPPVLTSISIGETDAPSWVQFRFYPVDSTNYCNLDLKLYADMSMVPSFLMGWIGSMAAQELVNTYRAIVQGHLESNLQKP